MGCNQSSQHAPEIEWRHHCTFREALLRDLRLLEQLQVFPINHYTLNSAGGFAPPYLEPGTASPHGVTTFTRRPPDELPPISSSVTRTSPTRHTLLLRSVI